MVKKGCQERRERAISIARSQMFKNS